MRNWIHAKRTDRALRRAAAAREPVVERQWRVSAPAATVIAPVLNERENVDELTRRIAAALDAADVEAEILFVDGGSTDGTPEAVERLAETYPVRLLETSGAGGLAADVLRAARAARGAVTAVIDADLSHPPETLPALLGPVLGGRCDMTIGSRRIPGGAEPDWPWTRRLTSRVASALAAPFVDVKDPMSGYFALRTETLLELGHAARGFKIGLEVLARGGDDLRVREIPIVFHDRRAGRTKFGVSQVADYLRQLGRLSGGRASTEVAGRWALVGLGGMGLDLALFAAARGLGAPLLAAHTVSFLVVTMVNFLLNWKWAFRDADTAPSYRNYFVTCVLAYIMRAGMIAHVLDVLHGPAWVALIGGVAAGAAVNYVGSVWFVFARRSGVGADSVRWRVFALAVIAYSVVTRLLYGGLMDLIPEEAYYWNYAQHLDYGYLDHPPMVAWLIWLSTSVLGRSELAVRLPALLAWAAAAIFTWKSARLCFNRTTAFVAVALYACLPVFFLTGMLTTPDAFLYACWTGCAYFLQCAILLERRRAWYAAGLFAGFGLLSKYTMALLGLAAIGFLLLDRRARPWWRRREPYLGLGIALAVFSPVLAWNAQHEWASFAFQTTRRLAAHPRFGLFELVGAAALLVTPFGLVGGLKVLLPDRLGGAAPRGRCFSLRARRLAAFMCFAPLAVFVLFSLQHSPKLNWAGVAFLAAIPFLANDICVWRPQSGPLMRWGRRTWRGVCVGMLLTMGFMGLYSISRFPGVTPVEGLKAYGPSVWTEMNAMVDSIRRDISDQVGAPALVAGMDKYFTSSELAFEGGARLPDGSARVAGRGLFPDIFHDRGLMWDRWVARRWVRGRPVVLLAFERSDLERPQLADRFDRLSPVQRRGVTKDDRLITAFYWRVGYGYRDAWREPSL